MYSPDKSWGCFLFGTYDCTYKPTAYKNLGRFWPFLQITVTEKLPQQAHSVGGEDVNFASKDKRRIIRQAIDNGTIVRYNKGIRKIYGTVSKRS